MPKNTHSTQGCAETLFKPDHILGHKRNLKKFRKIEITTCTLSHHNPMKFKIDSKQVSNKTHKLIVIKPLITR